MGQRNRGREKFLAWIGPYGALPDARIVLDDQESGDVLADWPDAT
ncbi:hypothetical protein [Streptomyces sp. NPDC046979]